AESLRDAAGGESALRRSRPRDVAGKEYWFAIKKPKDGPKVCKSLDGPWSEGIDAAKAALTRHETIDVELETAHLRGGVEPLVVDGTMQTGSGVLVAANGCFLLNATLANPARRALAYRVVQWAGDGPSNIAFVEGGSILSEPPSWPSVFSLLKVSPFGWVVA